MVERHPEVGKNAVYGVRAVEAQEVAQETEVAKHGGECRVAGEVGVGSGPVYRGTVLVETQQPTSFRPVESGEDCAGMTSTSKGAVDIHPFGAQIKSVERLAEQGRHMVWLGCGHCCFHFDRKITKKVPKNLQLQIEKCLRIGKKLST